MHIANELAITQALIAGVGIRASLASNNVSLDLIFRYLVDKVFHLNTNEMQHLGEAVLVYRVAETFFLIAKFEFLIDERNAF